MISAQEKQQMLQVLSSPHWSALEALANHKISLLKDDFGSRETEWETMKNNLLTEGKIQGIRLLIQEVYKLAQEAHVER